MRDGVFWQIYELLRNRLKIFQISREKLLFSQNSLSVPTIYRHFSSESVFGFVKHLRFDGRQIGDFFYELW